MARQHDTGSKLFLRGAAGAGGGGGAAAGVTRGRAHNPKIYREEPMLPSRAKPA